MKKTPNRSTAKKRQGARAASVKKLARPATAKKVTQPRKSEPREKQDDSRILKKERDEALAREATLSAENARLLTAIKEALDNQTASAEVLRTIAGTPAEAERALETICQVAARLLGASEMGIHTVAGDVLRYAAAVGPAQLRMRSEVPERPLDRETITGAAIVERRQIAVDDINDPAVRQRFPKLALVSLGRGPNSFVATPLLREGHAVGALVASRGGEVRPFTETELKQLQNFADQAVIAIENARLLAELRESLDRQTATSEVLAVISASPGDLMPVFENMLANAIRICGADQGQVHLFDGERFRQVAITGGVVPSSPEMIASNAAGRSAGFVPPPGTGLGRLAATLSTIHIADVATDPTFAEGMALIVREFGARTYLAVPMLREGVLVGDFQLHRRVVAPFSEKQIELVENFAKQAVIAIENARLLSELRESLDRQTATSDVLAAISSSPGELQPVFDMLLERVTRICAADLGGLCRVEDGTLYLVAARGGETSNHNARLTRGFRPSPGMALRQTISEKRTIHLLDLQAAPVDEEGAAQRAAATAEIGMRTVLHVPLLKDGEVVGLIYIYRREVNAFTGKQIELVENFAAQAVIAIENARLLSELRTRTEELTKSLDRQTATSEVLGMISASPGELQPVFETMLANAMRLCGAKIGTLDLADGDIFRTTAARGLALEELQRQGRPLTPGSGMFKARETKRPNQILDAAAEPALDDVRKRHPAIATVRTILNVPMLKEGAVVGIINLYRGEVLPFTDKQIELVESFAKQAVIAIENARLLSELRESLDRQTATSEVLGIISASPGDLNPVFDAMLKNAGRLCEFGPGRALACRRRYAPTRRELRHASRSRGAPRRRLSLSSGGVAESNDAVETHTPRGRRRRVCRGPRRAWLARVRRTVRHAVRPARAAPQGWRGNRWAHAAAA